MTRVVLCDDEAGRLTPLTDLRASFLVRTGARTTLERWASAQGFTVACVCIDESRAALTREQVGTLSVNDAAAMKGCVAVSGRLVMPLAEVSALAPGEALVDAAGGGRVVAAKAREGDDAVAVSAVMTGSSAGFKEKRVEGLPVLRRAWDVIRWRDGCLDLDLKDIARSWGPPGTGAVPGAGVVCVSSAAVFVHASAKVSPGVVLDAEGGPIVIDENATVRPGSIIVGPAYLGRGSSVLERGLIKAHTAIGPVCKVTGEVGGTIFQGYANKGHDGHLGDSWVGEWANFGAGTTNSNLLNTYGEVTATVPAPGASRERTGLQYLGCIVGDHTKFAICTRIMTGSVFGTGCMVATTAAPASSVPAFSWLTDERTQPYRFSKFLEVAKTVMARRKIVPSEAYVKAMERLTQPTIR